MVAGAAAAAGTSNPEPGQYADQFPDPSSGGPGVTAGLPHDNAGPKLNAIVWSLTAVAGVVLGLRVYCRLGRRRGLWWDDGFLIAAWLCITIESALVTAMTRLGYGLHIWDFDRTNNFAPLLVLVDVAGTLSVTAAIWSKTSFAITLLPLTEGWPHRTTWFILISMNIAMTLSALFPWVSCTPVQKTWDLHVDGTCWDPKVTVHYNIFSGVYSACCDVALALLPWQFIWGLTMGKKEKIGVGIAMSMGIVAGITGFVKVSMLPRMLSHDFADAVDLWIWGNVETIVTIIAASIPMLRVLVRDAAGSRKADGSDDSSKDQVVLTVGRRNTRAVAISSGAMASDTEMAKWVHDGDSARGILDDNHDRHEHDSEAIKMGRIVQTSDVHLQYDSDARKEDEAGS